MAKSPEPVVLELASLPREQMGAFLILGLDKSADKTTIETHWADRLKWARRQSDQGAAGRRQLGARGTRATPTRRIKADATSLNADTTDRILAHAFPAFRHGGRTGGAACGSLLTARSRWRTIVPPAEMPGSARGARGNPGSRRARRRAGRTALLQRLAEQPLDPWGLELPQQ